MNVRGVVSLCLLAAIAAASGPAAAQVGPAHGENEIGGIGRIVPAGGIVGLSGQAGFIVRAVAVHAGDKVKPGDLLIASENAVMKGDEAIAARDVADQKQLADARVAVATAALHLDEEKLGRAERELASYVRLGANAMAEKETLRLQENVAEAKLELAVEDGKLQQTRVEGGVAIADAGLRLDLAKAKSAQGELRAPIAGTILAVTAHVGDRLGGDVALQMADLGTLAVTCQVFEGELLEIAPGMTATIKNRALPKPLTGVVERIGRLIDTKARLGDVTIRLDSAEAADSLINMEVEVLIARIHGN
jgi:multidrug resistance efflux pump